jgi:hypothetical protein
VNNKQIREAMAASQTTSFYEAYPVAKDRPRVLSVDDLALFLTICHDPHEGATLGTTRNNPTSYDALRVGLPAALHWAFDTCRPDPRFARFVLFQKQLNGERDGILVGIGGDKQCYVLGVYLGPHATTWMPNPGEQNPLIAPVRKK